MRMLSFVVSAAANASGPEDMDASNIGVIKGFPVHAEYGPRTIDGSSHAARHCKDGQAFQFSLNMFHGLPHVCYCE